MAYSSVAVPAGEITDRNAGFPLASGIHAGDGLVISGTPSKWVAGATGDFADSDNTAADTPVRWVADRRGYKRSKPTGAATGHTLLLNLGTSAPDIDFIMIWGYGSSLDAAGGVAVSIEIADSSDFLTNPLTIASFTWPVSGRTKRVVLAQLSDGVNAESRLSGVQFMRLKFSATGSFTPEIGEVWLGRRRQFWENPLAGSGFSPNRIGRISSDSGPGQSTTRNTHARGIKPLEAQFRTTSSAEVDIIEDLWDDMNQGGLPFVWILDPSTTVLDDDAHVLLAVSEILDEPAGIGEFVRDFLLDGAEQSPFLKLELVP